MRRSVLLLLALLPLTATARMPWGDKAPWSEVDGTAVAGATDADAVELTVLVVNKKPLSVPKAKVTLVPGPQRLTIASARKSSNGNVAVPYTFVAEPCIRYRLAGRQSPNDSRLEIVVAAQEPITDCRAPAAVAGATAAPAGPGR
jgi:hypothetical protein